MGKGNLVDGVRRWFHRPSSSTRANNGNQARSSNPSGGDAISEGGGGGEEKEEVPIVKGELTVSSLPLIKVPKRSYSKNGPSAPDSYKVFSFSISSPPASPSEYIEIALQDFASSRLSIILPCSNVTRLLDKE